jgi:PmbA protein
MTDLEFSASVTTVRITNTSGLDVTYRCTDFSLFVVSVIVEGDSILWIGDGGNFGKLDLRTDEYVKKIADLARKTETKAPKIAGTLPVIFTAQEMPNLLKSIELGINGKRLLKGDSPLIGREGERVLGTVTLTDNPCLDYAPGSRPFDDEGVVSQKHVLFDNGVFQTFLFDFDTAAKTSSKSTASATRSMLSTPVIAPSNLIMSQGESSLQEMVKGIEEGIIVYGVLGGGQSNLLAGDFALNIMLGFLIRNGELAGRLVDTMVSGNVYEAFGNIAAMNARVEQVGSLFVPDVMFSELSVSSR